MKQIKIAITGPESSGKTTLSNSLNNYYSNSTVVNEFAREYLHKLERKYNYTDLLQIAKGQKKMELIASQRNTQIIISDTTLQVIKIWSFDKFKKCDPWILNQEENYTHYFLCKPDFPWQFDTLRENPINRDHLFNLYLNDLKNKPYTIILGNKDERLLIAKKIINQYLNK